MAVRLEATPPQATARRRRFRYTLPGAWVALVFACLAFTPSLLPRTALLQGVVCGITAAIGYGLGVVAAWTWRAFADRDPRPPRPGAWRVFAISAAALLVFALGLGLWWQAQLRDLMDAPAPNPLLLPLLPLAAAAIFTGLVALSRTLRGAYRRAAVRLQRWMGRRAARASAGWRWWPGPAWRPAGCGRAARGHWCPGSRWVARDGASPGPGRRPRRSPNGAGPRRRSRSGPTPAPSRPRTWRSAPSSPSPTWSGRVASTGPTCWSPRPPAAAGWTRARSTASSTSRAATRPRWPCSTSTSRPGSPTWSTRRRPGRRDASCSTRCMTAGPGRRPPTGRGCSCSA